MKEIQIAGFRSSLPEILFTIGGIAVCAATVHVLFTEMPMTGPEMLATLGRMMFWTVFLVGGFCFAVSMLSMMGDNGDD